MAAHAALLGAGAVHGLLQLDKAAFLRTGHGVALRAGDSLLVVAGAAGLDVLFVQLVVEGHRAHGLGLGALSRLLDGHQRQVGLAGLADQADVFTGLGDHFLVLGGGLGLGLCAVATGALGGAGLLDALERQGAVAVHTGVVRGLGHAARLLGGLGLVAGAAGAFLALGVEGLLGVLIIFVVAAVAIVLAQLARRLVLQGRGQLLGGAVAEVQGIVQACFQLGGRDLGLGVVAGAAGAVQRAGLQALLGHVGVAADALGVVHFLDLGLGGVLLAAELGDNLAVLLNVAGLAVLFASLERQGVLVVQERDRRQLQLPERFHGVNGHHVRAGGCVRLRPPDPLRLKAEDRDHGQDEHRPG